MLVFTLFSSYWHRDESLRPQSKGFSIVGHRSCVPWQPKDATRIEATLAVETRVVTADETIALATEALARARAAEAAAAVALARAAAQAAKDAAALANSSRRNEFLEDFPSEKDLLLLERARLSEMENDIFEVSDIAPTSLEPPNNISQEGTGLNDEVDTSIMDFSHALPVDTFHDLNGETSLQNEMIASPKRKGPVAAKSKRRGERLEKRRRAKVKSGKAADATAAAVEAAATSASKQGRSRKAINQVSTDPIRSFLASNGSRRSKLLTATEEIEFSRKVQVITHFASQSFVSHVCIGLIQRY